MFSQGQKISLGFSLEPVEAAVEPSHARGIEQEIEAFHLAEGEFSISKGPVGEFPRSGQAEVVLFLKKLEDPADIEGVAVDGEFEDELSRITFGGLEGVEEDMVEGFLAMEEAADNGLSLWKFSAKGKGRPEGLEGFWGTHPDKGHPRAPMARTQGDDGIFFGGQRGKGDLRGQIGTPSIVEQCQREWRQKYKD